MRNQKQLGLEDKKGGTASLEQFKCLDLCKEAIKILGIHFSYNHELIQKLNFNRVFDNFKMALSLWKSRTLTVYGRCEIVRTLAIPKLLCKYVDPPKSFLNSVQKEIVSFTFH